MKALKKVWHFVYHHRINFIRIDLDNVVHNMDASSAIDDAKKLAKKKRNKGVLTALKSTESEYKWVLLYNHARKVQIAPKSMRRMRRADLQYLAGMTFAHPDLISPRGEDENGNPESIKAFKKRHEQATKMQGNAARAQNELKSRDIIRSGLLAALAALVGAIVTVLLSKAWGIGGQ